MSDPYQPPKVGFPQAFQGGTAPYQPLQQFSQYQSTPLQNSIGHCYVAPNQQMPASTQPRSTPLQFKEHQVPQTFQQPPMPSAFKPLQPAVNSTYPQHTSNGAFPSPVYPPPPNLTQTQPVLTTNYLSHGPPSFQSNNSVPQFPTPGTHSSITTAVATNGVSAYPPAPTSIPSQTSIYSGQQALPNQPHGSTQPQYSGYPTTSLQQNFSQMSIYQPSGHGQITDIVDLISYRNPGGELSDIPIKLTQMMANNKARCDPSIFRSTMNAVPCNEELLKKSRLPFGITLHPFRDMKNLNIIQTSTIVRCRYCRTYINPFVHFPDSRHWKCNLCNRQNDLPDDFCWDPVTKTFGDPTARPEIRHATVEFIAPAEYMPVRVKHERAELRPPQAAVYIFILDVSAAAIESGYLYAFTEQILINLDQLPGDDRAQIAFIAVDSCVHFFQFEENSTPRQLIVDDIEDIYLPTNTGLLVNIKKQKDAIRSFVKEIPIIFDRPASSSNCLGSALLAVKELIFETGGRITVFQCILPNIGPGSLKAREDPNQRASQDVQNLGPATDFYKRLALECTGQQIAMDLFMLNTQYADLASISEICKFSTGCVYHFPNYHCFDMIQVKRFEKIFTRYLTRKIGFEAVLRIRCSRGLALSAFYGNFFVRSTDLLALANVNPDSALAVQVNMEEKLGSTVVFQAALLYTSSKGDRRIRVHTMCLPTSSDLNEIYNSFDLKATVSLLCKISVERSMSGSPLTDSREAVVNAVVDSLGAYKKAIGNGRGAMPVPLNGHLRHFPVFALAMLKHSSLSSGGRSIKLDERVASMLMLRFSPLEQILSDLHANLYRINEIVQLPDGQYPSPLPLSFEYISRDGVFVMEAGTSLFIYVSSGADANFISEVFGCSYNDVEKSTFDVQGNPTSERVHAFIKHITMLKFYLGQPIILKEDSPLREIFVRRLIEDRTESTHSYHEFLQHIKREMSQ